MRVHGAAAGVLRFGREPDPPCWPGSYGCRSSTLKRCSFFCASAFGTGSCQQFAGLLRLRPDTPARRNVS
ncbi:hypothetical protein ACFU98_16440 [Streptomyces sp. NPDC057575]|uniref:hypothetical protein n=1 Tax=unclassified Streptomyces TaxID=2593676 RepID=UPI0036BFCF3C